jgi:hypothetical protein
MHKNSARVGRLRLSMVPHFSHSREELRGGHQDNPHARKVGLVLDEGAELEEVPVGVSCPLLSLNRDPLVDAPEVLDGKTASGALAFCTTCLAMMWLVLRW